MEATTGCRRCGGSVDRREGEAATASLCSSCDASDRLKALVEPFTDPDDQGRDAMAEEIVIDLSDANLARLAADEEADVDLERVGPDARPQRGPSIRDLRRNDAASLTVVAEPPAPVAAPPTGPTPPEPVGAGAVGSEPGMISPMTTPGIPPRDTTPEAPRPDATSGPRDGIGDLFPSVSIVHSVLDGRNGLGIDVLHDRAVPGCPKPIDRVVIAPSGVWVIDAFEFAGRVVTPPPPRRFRPERPRLVVGGRTREDLIADVHCRVGVVRGLLAEVAPDVPVHGCLCFRVQDMGRGTPPFTVDSVLIAGRSDLASALGASNVITAERRPTILAALDAGLAVGA